MLDYHNNATRRISFAATSWSHDSQRERHKLTNSEADSTDVQEVADYSVVVMKSGNKPEGAKGVSHTVT